MNMCFIIHYKVHVNLYSILCNTKRAFPMHFICDQCYGDTVLMVPRGTLVTVYPIKYFVLTVWWLLRQAGATFFHRIFFVIPVVCIIILNETHAH